MDHYAQSLIQGISAAARDYSCNLLLGCGFSVTGKSPQHHSFWPVPGEKNDFVPIGPWNTDGLIIVPDELEKEQLHYVRDLLDSGFPVIFTTPEGPGPLVSVDNFSGIRSAFQHLYQHGCRRIAFIAGNPGHGGDSGERLRAYQDALYQAGLPFLPKLCAYGEHRKEGGALAMRQILASGETFDGLIASNDLSCIGAIEVLKQAGVHIPEDVAVIGFDDILEARSITPALTTVRLPTFTLGYQSVITLLDFMNKKNSGNIKVTVPTRLIIRESCGCRSGMLKLQTESYSKEKILDSMAQAILGEARHTPYRDLYKGADLFFEQFLQSCLNKDCEGLSDGLKQLTTWANSHGEEMHIWRAAAGVLLENLNNLGTLYPALDLPQATLFLEQIRQILNEQIQRKTTRGMVEFIQMTSQLGQLTAEMLSAMSIEQTAEILSTHLPQVGMKNVLVAIYEADPEDESTQGTVLFGAGLKNKLTGLNFNPRMFPTPGMYPSDSPIQLIILPLTIDQNMSGFAAFDAPNPEFCAAVVHNLSAALRTSRLYQDALTGRKLAEEANQLKSRFLSMVSHELRTPLSLIVGLSEMSLKGKPVDINDIEQINTSAQHLARLIGDVLDLASSEAGQLRILREPLDFREILGVALKIGEEMVLKKGLDWMVIQPEQTPWVLGDQTRLRQITLNLISNAVKFTNSGEVRVEIEVENNQVSVSVSDTGLGIPKKDLRKVFNEFYRTDRIIEAGIGGMGLGLAITKQLVEVHDGTISVQSPGRLGKGTTFTFTLPVLTSGPNQPDFSNIISVPGSTIVVLQEGEKSPDDLETYLIKEHYSVMVINLETEKDWLSAILSSQPAAIILNEALAVKNGWSIAGLLKQQKITANTPIYAYALDPKNNRGEILELNYLHKPIHAEQLGKELARVLPVDQTNPTILIVEDDPDILNMHRRLVEDTGKTVITARNGREAMEIIKTKIPDLILLDLVMPEMDGFAVLDALHSGKRTRDIPVIILTARLLSDADIERCNRGVASILSKGVFSAEETLTHIEAALSQQDHLNTPTRQLIRRAIAIIHERYAESISREDLASGLSISADYLTDCFRQEFGITPMTYLRRYRIKQACELLLNSDQSITRVAMKVGFSDSAHFTHTFVREIGMSPKMYRKKTKR